MKILLVEDSRRLQAAVSKGLQELGFVVDVAGDGEEGLWRIESNAYDVVVLDLMLPIMDGLTVLQSMRTQSIETSVLILTAKDSLEERVKGLEMGADDYLVKPFEFLELVARIQALLRRSYKSPAPHISIGCLTIDTSARQVLCNESRLDLTAREYALLELLAFKRGEVVSRTEIEEHIYDERVEPMSNVVDSAICILRRKISKVCQSPLIHTRRGQGYILEVDET